MQPTTTFWPSLWSRTFVTHKERFLESLELRKLVFQVSFLPFASLLERPSPHPHLPFFVSSLSCDPVVGTIASSFSALLPPQGSTDTPHMVSSVSLGGEGGGAVGGPFNGQILGGWNPVPHKVCGGLISTSWLPGTCSLRESQISPAHSGNTTLY